MKNFEFYSPTHYVFGRGAELKAGVELARLGCSMCWCTTAAGRR